MEKIPNLLKHGAVVTKSAVRHIRYASIDQLMLYFGLLLLLGPRLAKELHLLPEAPIPIWLNWVLGLAGLISVGASAFRLYRRVVAPPSLYSGPPAVPLKGAGAFTPIDGGLFERLGRRNEIAQLREAVHDDQVPFIVLIGETGAGKTSLLRAGLIPSLKPDEIEVIYSECSRGTRTETSLQVATKSATEGSLTFEDLCELVLTGTGRRYVVIVDQAERLVHDKHNALFKTIKRMSTGDPPYALTWILSFQKNAIAEWLDFELAELPSSFSVRGKRIFLRLFSTRQALEVSSVLVEEAALELNEEVLARVLDSVSRGGKVLPLDIGICLLMFNAFRQETDGGGLDSKSFSLMGGHEGLMRQYLSAHLERIPEIDQDGVHRVLHALAGNEQAGRPVEGKTWEELRSLNRNTSDTRFRNIIEYLASSNVRLLEKIQFDDQVHFRLTHDALSRSLRSVGAQSGGELTKLQYRIAPLLDAWSEHQENRFLLRGKDFHLAWSYRELLALEDRGQEIYSFIVRSRKIRNIRLGLIFLSALVVLALSLSLFRYQTQLQRRDRLDYWGLPSDLYEKQKQLKVLSLPPLVEDISWIKAELSRLDLSSTRVRDLNGLPETLEFLSVANTPIGNDSLRNLPAGLLTLDVSNTSIRHLPKLPSRLESFFASSTNIDLEEARFPTSLKLVDLSGVRIESLDNLVLPNSLQELRINRTGLRAISGEVLSNLKTLEVSELDLRVHPRFPEGIQSLDMSDSSGIRWRDIPDSVERLRTSSREQGEFFQDLPENLTHLGLYEIWIEDSALPESLRSLDLVGTVITADGIELPPYLENLHLAPSQGENRYLAAFLGGIFRAKGAGEAIDSLFGSFIPELSRSLPYLPRTLRSLKIEGLDIQSFANLSALELRELSLKDSRFPSLPVLPDSLVNLDLSGVPTEPVESLLGSGLPENSDGLKVLILRGLELHWIEKLPPKIEELDISHTRISLMPPLPETLRVLDISHSQIESLAGLPENLEELTVAQDQLRTLEGLPAQVTRLHFVR